MRLEIVEIAEAHVSRRNDDGAGRNRRSIQLETPRRAHDDPVESRIVGGGAAAGPHIRCRQVGALADGIRADLAARLNAPRRLVFPHLPVGKLERPTIFGLQPHRTRTAIAPIAKQGKLLRRDPQSAHRLFGLGQVRGAAAHEGQRIAQVSVHPRIDPREVAHGGNVAGFRDQREGLAPIQQRRKIDQRRRGAIARTRTLEHRRRIEAQAAFGPHRFRRRSGHMQNEFRAAAREQELPQRRQHPAGRPAMAHRRIAGIADGQLLCDSPHHIPRRIRIRSALRRPLHASPRANCVDEFERRRIQGSARDRPLAAFRSQNDVDLFSSGDASAQSAADAESAFDNRLQRKRNPSSVHFCSRAIAAEDIAVTPVRNVGSGSGSKRLLCGPGSNLPAA